MVIYNSKLVNILNRVFKHRIRAIALWPFILVFDDTHSDVLLAHENIHLRQQEELFVLGFYVVYGYYHIKGLIKHKTYAKAYRLNPFEMEAFDRQYETRYLKVRQPMSWRRYV